MAAKRFALMSAALACITVAASATAQADPGDDFLRYLNMYGIDLSAMMGHTISPQDAIELGQDICGDLHKGASPTAEANGLYRTLPRITDKQSGNLVSAAQLTLCPDTMR